MPEGKIISYSPGEYPELDNLPEGTKVSFNGQATIVKTQGTEEGGEGEGSLGLQIDSIELDPEGEADRTLKDMTQNDSNSYASNEDKGGGF
jgi:hypothetical protein